MSVLIYPTLAGSQMEVERTPYYGTVIQTEASGRELTITQQVAPRYRYRISYDFLRQDGTTDEAATLLSFLAAMRGSYDSFLFLDPYDSTVTAQEFGVGDGAEDAFQLQRNAGGTVTDLLGTWPVYTTSRTNLLTYSEDFANAAWSNTGSAETSNAALSPDGVGITADKLTEDTSTGAHSWYRSLTLGTATYTWSIYAKAGERSKFALYCLGLLSATFDLSAGTVDVLAGTTATITAVGNGWYRCVATHSRTAGTDDYIILLYSGSSSSYTGTSGYGMYFWGTQLETGSTATRYVPTTSAAVTQRPSWWGGTGLEGWEPIYAPAWASVSITSAGVAVPCVSGSTGWVPGTAGSLTFGTAPASGNALAWTGTFYRRVRLASDSLQTRRRTSRIWSGEVELVSVIG